MAQYRYSITRWLCPKCEETAVTWEHLGSHMQQCHGDKHDCRQPRSALPGGLEEGKVPASLQAGETREQAEAYLGETDGTPQD